jgi:hypothetical protein
MNRSAGACRVWASGGRTVRGPHTTAPAARHLPDKMSHQTCPTAPLPVIPPDMARSRIVVGFEIASLSRGSGLDVSDKEFARRLLNEVQAL